MPEQPSSTPAPSATGEPASNGKDSVLIVRMWPKTPVLYPMALVALICCIVAHVAGSSQLSDYPFAKESRPEVQDPSGTELPEADEAPIDLGPVTPPPDAEPGDPDPGNAQLDPVPDRVLAAQAGGSDPAATDTAQDREIEKKRVDRTLAVIFLIVLFISLFSICVDMDVRWALIYFSGLVILFLVLWIIDISVGVFPTLLAWLDKITPMANPQFYLGVFAVWLLLFLISIIVTRFHYVRIEHNEVIVVGGMLERQQRYSTMRMRYVKEIHDVMEFYLPFVRSGRLILSFPEQSEAVIIDNVLNIKKVTAKLDKLVSSFQIVGD